MSGQEEALRKMLQELQTQAITSSRSLSSTRTLLMSKEREKKLVQLTRGELGLLDEKNGDRVYRGVGKMFVLESLKGTLGTLQAREKETSDDIVSLGKKLKYLENESAQAQAGLKEIFEHQKRQ
ncbi:MAG: hypothetical protein CYPHOPRED_004787 [Cyphobasidiales sp. Tagirdzhanova-0007]|nr:MAG: hypothetical protein CYPHOPRED_004787 [Cyphobasidiales sp. Tagirdzhanova-0007]